MAKFYLITLTGLILMAGCKSAEKSFQNGNYADAVELGLKQLQKNPTDAETKALVQSAYNLAQQSAENQIRILSNSNYADRYEKIYGQYLQLQDLYTTIQAYPVAARSLNATDYASYLQTYRAKIVDLHLERADKWMEENSRDAYKRAYDEIKKALRYDPQNINILKQKDAVFSLAAVHVLLTPVQTFADYRYAAVYHLNNFETVLRRQLQSSSNDFVLFYTESELRSRNIQPDEVLEFQLATLAIGQPFDEKSTRTITKKVIVKETVYAKDSVVKEYATVKATVTTTQRHLLSEAILLVSSHSADGRAIWNDRVKARHEWNTEWVSYTGDERALPENDKALINKTRQHPPQPRQIEEALYNQLQSNAAYRLKNYYRNY